MVSTEVEPSWYKQKVLWLKIILIIFLLGVIGDLIYQLKKEVQANAKKTLVCGKITDKFSQGAKTNYLVVYSDSLGRKVAVEASLNKYVNTNIGAYECFKLSGKQLEE